MRWAIFVAAAIAVAVAIAFAGSGTQPIAPRATPTVSVPTIGPITTPQGESPTLTARLKRPIDQILAELPFTNIAFAAPTRLRLDQTAVVTLRTSDEQSIEELQSQLRNVGRREGARIRASDVMEATLTGIDFEIRQITPKQQPVGAAVTEWKWQVRPTEAENTTSSSR